MNVIQVVFIFSSLLLICSNASLTFWVYFFFTSSFFNNWISMFLRDRFFWVSFSFWTTGLWAELMSAPGNEFALLTNDLNRWFINMKPIWFRTLVMPSSWGDFLLNSFLLVNLNILSTYPYFSHLDWFSNNVIYWSFSNVCVHIISYFFVNQHTIFLIPH